MFSPSFIKSKGGLVGFTVVKVEHTDSEFVVFVLLFSVLCTTKFPNSVFQSLFLFHPFLTLTLLFERFLSLRIWSHQTYT